MRVYQNKPNRNIGAWSLIVVCFLPVGISVSHDAASTQQRIAERLAAIKASNKSRERFVGSKMRIAADSKLATFSRQKDSHSGAKSIAKSEVFQHCPILLSGSPTCDAPPARLPVWCVPSMKDVDGSKIMQLARQRNKALGGICTCNGAKFATELRDEDTTRFQILDHFTINHNNTRVTRLLSPKYWSSAPLNDLPQLPQFNFSHCAVVGSSDSVYKKKRGQEIDNHDVIFRFNEAPTAGFEPYVGSRTTFRIQNPEREGFSEGKGEWCLTKGYGTAKKSTNCKRVSLSPQFNEYTRHLWSSVPVPQDLSLPHVNGVERSKMSSGFQGIALALNLCQRVEIYGMSQGSGYYFPKVPTKSTLPWQKRHPWELERKCLKILIDKLPAQVKIVV